MTEILDWKSFAYDKNNKGDYVLLRFSIRLQKVSVTSFVFIIK